MDQDILHFLQREVVEKGHPFVMMNVEPGAQCLSLTSSLGSLSGFQVTYHWQLLDNPVTGTLCYIIAADGLTKILKLLQHDLPRCDDDSRVKYTSSQVIMPICSETLIWPTIALSTG